MATLITLGLAMVVAGCSGPLASSSPAVTDEASASPIAAEPTAAPTLEPSPTLEPEPTNGSTPNAFTAELVPELSFVNKFVMRVAVTDLNVRRSPTRSAPSNGKAPKGGLFMMYDWPVVADGYTWYFGFTLLTAKPGVLPALPEAIETGYDEVLVGWMATGTEDTPFLVPVAPRCPTVRDLRNVGAMLDSERLSCFGSASLTLEGAYGCRECGGDTVGTYEPDWLAGPLNGEPIGADGVELIVRFAPDGPTPPAPGTRIRVHGHFSDSRSTTCRIKTVPDDGDALTAVHNDAAEQWCRSSFVVDSFEVIG